MSGFSRERDRQGAHQWVDASDVQSENRLEEEVMIGTALAKAAWGCRSPGLKLTELRKLKLKKKRQRNLTVAVRSKEFNTFIADSRKNKTDEPDCAKLENREDGIEVKEGAQIYTKEAVDLEAFQSTTVKCSVRSDDNVEKGPMLNLAIPTKVDEQNALSAKSRENETEVTKNTNQKEETRENKTIDAVEPDDKKTIIPKESQPSTTKLTELRKLRLKQKRQRNLTVGVNSKEFNTLFADSRKNKTDEPDCAKPNNREDGIEVKEGAQIYTEEAVDLEALQSTTIKCSVRTDDNVEKRPMVNLTIPTKVDEQNALSANSREEDTYELKNTNQKEETHENKTIDAVELDDKKAIDAEGSQPSTTKLTELRKLRLKKRRQRNLTIAVNSKEFNTLISDSRMDKTDEPDCAEAENNDNGIKAKEGLNIDAKEATVPEGFNSTTVKPSKGDVSKKTAENLETSTKTEVQNARSADSRESETDEIKNSNQNDEIHENMARNGVKLDDPKMINPEGFQPTTAKLTEPRKLRRKKRRQRNLTRAVDSNELRNLIADSRIRKTDEPYFVKSKNNEDGVEAKRVVKIYAKEIIDPKGFQSTTIKWFEPSTSDVEKRTLENVVAASKTKKMNTLFADSRAMAMEYNMEDVESVIQTQAASSLCLLPRDNTLTTVYKIVANIDVGKITTNLSMVQECNMEALESVLQTEAASSLCLLPRDNTLTTVYRIAASIDVGKITTNLWRVQDHNVEGAPKPQTIRFQCLLSRNRGIIQAHFTLPNSTRAMKTTYSSLQPAEMKRLLHTPRENMTVMPATKIQELSNKDAADSQATVSPCLMPRAITEYQPAPPKETMTPRRRSFRQRVRAWTRSLATRTAHRARRTLRLCCNCISAQREPPLLP